MGDERTYSIAEAAEKLRVSKSTLYRWFEKGDIVEVRRDRNNWRVFSSADLRAIRKAKGL